MQRKKALLLDLDERGGRTATLMGLLVTVGELDVELSHDPNVLSKSIFRSSSSAEKKSAFEKDLVLAVFPSRLVKAGILFVENVSRRHPEVPILVIVLDALHVTEAGTFRDLGVNDLITPPFFLHEILPHICELYNSGSSAENFDDHMKQMLGLLQLVGESPKFLAEVQKISLSSQFDLKVLIRGETGTGKEMFARAIHYLSPRAHKPFVAVNCGAIPVDLIENELFGHERGAFTGADMARSGLIQEANMGTLFLDEIDSLPLSAQVKLLRFIQDNEYRPLGSPTPRKADVRLIAATQADLGELAQRQLFRSDLYYRLNVLSLTLPPLRDRRSDIILLAKHFFNKYSTRFHKNSKGFSDEAILRLCVYDWPGNVRELENIVERAVALTQHSEIQIEDLNLPTKYEYDARRGLFENAKRNVVIQFEKEYLKEVLFASRGNISHAARLAGKDRRVFWQLMQKHGIDAAAYRNGNKQLDNENKL